jgi:antitoxin MazE
MLTKVQKWGNSQGLRISKDVLADADLAVGDAVKVAAREGTIVITPARRVRGRHSLAALVKELPSHYKVGEFDWGSPAGREVW